MNRPDPSSLSGFPDPDTTPDVAEISLLLPGWQLTILESAAHERGLTSGQMVRRLIRDFCDRHEEGAVETDDKLNVACQW
jgi:hypothetical protein